MTARAVRWIVALSLVPGLFPEGLAAAEQAWHPRETAAVLGRPIPIATLAPPVSGPDPDFLLTPLPPNLGGIAPVSYNEPSLPLTPPLAVPSVGGPAEAPIASTPPIASIPAVAGDLSTSVSLAGPPPVDPPAGNPSFPGVDGSINPSVNVEQPLNKGFWDRCRDWFGGHAHSQSSTTHNWFISDHAFDESGMVSPVSNPFFFEDPRALTEVRPLIIYQAAPNKNFLFHGGSSEFFGLQGSVAFNEHWSVVINKLGAVAFQPDHEELGFKDGTGFAELWLGPKWTFLRNEQTGTVAATGVTFQLPVGSKQEFQNTGSLTLDPYLSVAQTICGGSFGNFGLMGNAGYAIATDNQRSDYFHASTSLSYDIVRAHTWYPLLEMNWFHYTGNGKANYLDFEGMDLANFGSRFIAGRDLVTLDLGVRWKPTQCMQFGLSLGFPVTSPRDLEVFRLTTDVIFRY